MALMTKPELEQLGKTRGTPCISIYIPTHRAGAAVLEGKDALELKNQLKKLRHGLDAQGMDSRAVAALLAPIQELLTKGDFWRHRSDGLAIFRTAKVFGVHTLPLSFEAFCHVGPRFHLKPLMPLFHGDGKFFVLGLEKAYVRLYEMTRHSWAEVPVQDLVPGRLNEAVERDYRPKGLQFRSGADGQGRAMYHGHAEADRNHKVALGQFCRAVSKGLGPLLREEKAPLLLVCQEMLFPIYQKENGYAHLLDTFLDQSPASLSPQALHQMAWERLAPVFKRERAAKHRQFLEAQGRGRTATDLGDVLAAAHSGLIDTLFIRKGAHVWGTYDADKRTLQLHPAPQPNSVSLTDRAAMSTFLKGGKVYLVEAAQMPHGRTKMNALFRF
ncbi:hypothetical protein [Maribacter sp. 2307ULW6-5]|uniref:baeRF3 domain-containing protein n=1 Tax=Maribacter sp. 2307ULW6-5 TaxID=3386275 RepID=UPI0039BD4CE7